MTVEQGVGEPHDRFPIGMRVLAVDDDPTCLLLLETLLRRCQYHVTTTNQAMAALKMLRENKNKFDLVISDVHMPDMDGFKLLELVGLEMDLPVIMLSANGDPKLVMKGITHGACDYLLKPVRMEELKNIWQHVIRRRKFDNKDRNNLDNPEKFNRGSGEATADQKLNKKRKDQNEDEDEERDESRHENEDPTTQKKPRVVWSVELHRKFVAAVNQLGIDKAVPKKILDLMNVEKLTRENVASHLQKYRLYLKRISTVANQQANMVAALGSTDASFLQMGSVGFQNLAGTGQYHNAAFRSLPQNGVFSRLNSPAGLGMRGLPSSGVIQLGHLQTTNHLNDSQSHFLPVGHPGNDGNVLQGMPTSLDIDQIQSNKGVSYIRELPAVINDTTAFSVSSGFSDIKQMASSSNNHFLGVSNKPLMLEGNAAQGVQDGQKFRRQASLTVDSLDSGFSSHFLDPGRCNDIWSNDVQSTAVQSNSFALNDSFKQATLHASNIGDGISAMALQSGNNSTDASSMSTLPIHLQDSKADMQFQIASVRSSAGQMINNPPQGWNDQRLDVAYQSNSVCSSINSTSPINGTGSPIGQSLDPNNAIFHRTMSFNSTRQPNFVNPSLMKNSDVENLAMDTMMRSNEGYAVGQQKTRGSYIFNNFGSLEDIASVMVKQEQEKVTVTDGEFECDLFS